MKRQILYTFVVYLVEVAVVVGYVAGWIPVHPIVLMLPLVGLINYQVEGEGHKGLGMVLVRPVCPGLLVLVFATLSLAEHLIRLRVEGISLQLVPFSATTMGSLVKDLVVDVVIIALWEEIVVTDDPPDRPGCPVSIPGIPHPDKHIIRGRKAAVGGFWHSFPFYWHRFCG